MKPGLLSLLLTAATLAPLAAQQQQPLTPQRILDLRTVLNAQIAPDGAQVVFQLSRSRTAAERPGAAISELWTVPVTGGPPRRLTWNESSDTAPAWSPSGRTLAFLSRRGTAAVTQIYLIGIDGGEARPLTTSESAVTSFRWSPDGARIAYTAADAKTKAERDAEAAGRDWTVVDQNPKHNRLSIVDVATGGTRMVSGPDYSVQEFDWSPDGAQFVAKVIDAPSVDDDFMRGRLMTLPATGGDLNLVAKTEGKLTHPRWSPDCKWIAWLGATELKDPYAGSVFYAPATGGGAVNLTPKYDGTANALDFLPGAPATIIFGAIERQHSVVHAITLPGGERKPVLAPGVIFNGAPSFTGDGKTFAIAAATPAHPNEVFVGTAGAIPRRLTRHNEWLDRVALGEQEIFRWKSRDGLALEGILIKPVGFEKGRRYPVVIQPHGGPESADLNGWYGSYSRWGQMLAGHGFLVFYPNYRGSIGRGVAFSMADQRDLMGREFEDMLDGIDALAAAGLADAARVGSGGGSYGGYASAWAATFASERFKAAVPWMGITNWFSMTGTSDIFYENSVVHWDLMMADPANHDIYWKRSPMAYIHKANTPSLIIHGAADTRVPIGQSQELYTALKHKGVPVEFVIYPREGHGVSETAHQLDFMQRVLGWFQKYLK